MVSRRKRKPQIISYIIIIILSFIFVYPFWQTVVISFSDKVYANSNGFKFWPNEIVFDAYKTVFKTNSFFIGYRNTIIRTVLGTLITLVITFCASYAITHKALPGRNIISFFIVFTMFFSGGLVPTYLNLKNLHLLNTIWVLILPGAAGAWNFIIMRNFISSIGTEIEDAARIDGANEIQTMVQIILPLSKAVVAVVALWSVVSHWNAWYDSMVYASDSKLVVLQVVVRRLIDEGDETAASGDLQTLAATTTESIRCATIVVATVPILAGYPFVQKYLVKGTMVGAIKG